MDAERKSFHRFKTQFVDTDALWGSFELPQPETRNRDVVSLKYWLIRMRRRHPEMAQYIIDTARLIVEASESEGD